MKIKEAYLKNIIETAQTQLVHSPAYSYFPIFVQEFFRHISLKELQRKKRELLINQVCEAWQCFQTRHKGDPPSIYFKEFLGSQDQYSSIVIINDDRPFLYDSLTLFLEREGVKPSAFYYPVWYAVRDKQGELLELYHRDEGQGGWESLMFFSFKDLPVSADFLTKLGQLMKEVCSVVDDWPVMRTVLEEACKNLAELETTEANATKDYLQWLDKDHFIFLASRYFTIKEKHKLALAHKGEALGLFRETYYQKNIFLPLAKRLIDKKKHSLALVPRLMYHKVNQRSQIHTPSRITCIEVVDQTKTGNIKGIFQFLGLYTRAFFSTSVFNIPIIQDKAKAVLERFHFSPRGWNSKVLMSILNSIPQDEILEASEDELYEMANKIFYLQEDKPLALFVRQDPFAPFITVLIYMAKERYSFDVKQRFSEILSQVLGGAISPGRVLIGEVPFARLVFVLTYKTLPNSFSDLILLEEELSQATLSWNDSFIQEINHQYSEEQASTLIHQYQEAFGLDYQEKFSVSEAMLDLPYLEKLLPEAPISIRFYQLDAKEPLKIKIYHYGQVLSLSTLLPILHHLGLQPTAEIIFRIDRPNKNPLCIHDFELQDSPYFKNFTKNGLISLISEGFQRIWNGDIENDSFNRLIILGKLTWQQVVIIRSLANYLKQIKIPYSIAYMEKVLNAYPMIVRKMVHFFELKFSPQLKISREKRLEKLDKQMTHIKEFFQTVESLDHDRILNHILNLIQAMVRTNYFQNQSFKSYLAFKFQSQQIMDLPEPHPFMEVFIYSPRFQAIHLRNAKVARGGIRWSDRPEDFRTEILSLMKAQNIKNAIIIPFGAKGGFVLKNPQNFPTLKALQEEGAACYQLMIHGLLDLTDNFLNGTILPPLNTVRYDEEDPYLVIAADKGTSRFSDIANRIAQKYGFWLDDAFASGGSTGYDHKKMGITSRGTWESIKRHFQEMGRNIQKEEFTVVGIGDMSGDVFGNGMLQSRYIKLLAAFNNQHIFLDPNPDPEVSFMERERLYELPFSSWANYRPELISKGGSIFDRRQKRVPLSKEIRDFLAINETSLPPEILIQAILKAPVDLIWFGGIGTFVKASRESHSEVNDSANDTVRVDAKDLRAKVIGEGANLGMTQKGRIEYALNGGKINADFIDNSAGVDCSDHEVNIKILLQKLLLAKRIGPKKRDTLLKEMTEEIAVSIIRDNYLQSQILSQIESLGASAWGRWQYLMRVLKNTIELDRTLEYLPDDDTIEQRRVHSIGPTRPELAVLLAYSKISLAQQILQINLENDPLYDSYLLSYFPTCLIKTYTQAILEHPLRRELLATLLANALINRMGPLFVPELMQALGCELSEILQAFFLIHQWLDLETLWKAIESLDEQKFSQKQLQAFQMIQGVLAILTARFIKEGLGPNVLMNNRDHYLMMMGQWMTKRQLEDHEKFAEKWKGFPSSLAKQLTYFPFIPAMVRVHHLASFMQKSFEALVKLYFQINESFALDHLSQILQSTKRETDWQETMVIQLFHDLMTIQSQLILNIASLPEKEGLKSWEAKFASLLPLLRSVQPNVDLAYLSYILNQLKKTLDREGLRIFIP